jgi:hypothetical protein
LGEVLVVILGVLAGMFVFFFVMEWRAMSRRSPAASNEAAGGVHHVRAQPKLVERESQVG